MNQNKTIKTLSWKSGAFAISFVIANLFSVNKSIAQIAIRGASTTGSSTNSSLVINKPLGVVAGDVMILNIDEYPTNTTPTLSGWTLIAGPATLGGTNYGFILYRVANGSEGSTFTFTIAPTNQFAAGSIVAFSGVDVTGGFLVGGAAGGPFDVAPGSISTTGGLTTSLTITSIITNSANAAVVMLGMSGSTVNPSATFTSWSTTSPGALSEIYDNNGGSSVPYLEIGAAWGTKATAGSTGTSSLILSKNMDVGGILIALKKLCPLISTTAGSNSPVCIGSTINLTATNASGGTSPYTYSWSGPNSYSSSTQNPSLTSSTAAMSGTYTVTAKDNTGCTGSSNITVTVSTLPAASVSPANQSNLTCNLSGNGSITITASLGSGTYIGYSVTNGIASVPLGLPAYQPSPTFNNLTAGQYQIRVKDSNGCESKQVQ